MRKIKHWTPRYIGDRLRVLAYERRHPEAPWLTGTMVSILESWLRPSDVGFEWGSGRSTIWLAKRIKHLVSVEHDEIWHQKIVRELNKQALSNVDYKLCPNDIDYVSVVRNLALDSLDFCLVDGQRRDECAVAAIPKMKSGGILVIDNCNWYLPSNSKSPNSRPPQERKSTEEWRVFLDLTKDWRCIWTTSGVTDSALWLKPLDSSVYS